MCCALGIERVHSLGLLVVTCLLLVKIIEKARSLTCSPKGLIRMLEPGICWCIQLVDNYVPCNIASVNP
jgi:hypothetical protein